MTAADPPVRVDDTADAVISLRDAGASVGGRQVWSGVDTTVRSGEFVAVLGPNGAGKSTLLKVILGLVPSAPGTVTVLGGAPGRHNGSIGYLPQRRSFDRSARIRGVDVVRLGLDGHRWGLPFGGRFRRTEREARQRVEQVIALVGAQSYAHRPIEDCSGGEQQRLLIAQALARRPRVLLLDEPLDSLDLPNQTAISALLASICHSQGVAVVMVAHDVNPLIGSLDSIVYLARGRASSGPPSQVVTSRTLTELYQTPIDVLVDRAGRLVVVGQPDVPAGLHG